VAPLDLIVRNATYRLFVELGRAPSVDEVGAATGEGSAEVGAAWRRLHDGHALVLDQAGAIRMLNPFSAVETPFVVEAAGKTWFANCGWDAFGIGAALHVDSMIHTTCPDCGEAIDIDVRDGGPTETGPVWHVLVPARDWWSDIGFT
jgi:Alkylmercury lyase